MQPQHRSQRLDAARPRRASRTGRTGRPTRPVAASTERQNAVRLAILRTRPPQRIAPPAPSHVVTAAYKARLQVVVDRSWAIVQRTILPAVQRQIDAPATHTDAKRKKPAGEQAQPKLPMDVEASLTTMAGQLQRYSITIPATAIAGAAATATEASAHAMSIRISETLGLRAIDAGTQIDAARKVWIAENSALIVSQPREISDRIETKVNAMVQQGSRWETIAKQLEDEHGIASRRAELIARDQVSKFNGALNQINQTSVGITHYEWLGAMDARERPEHVALQGMIFAWDSPPPIGHPGEPIQCRCTAAPIYAQTDLDRAAKQPVVDESWLTQRTIALGPKARDVGKTPAELATLARKSVRAEIQLAQNRKGLIAAGRVVQRVPPAVNVKPAPIVPPVPTAPVVKRYNPHAPEGAAANYLTMHEPAAVALWSQDLRKLPNALVEAIVAAQGQLHLVDGVVTNSPAFAWAKSVQLRGHAAGVTWDTIGGGYENHKKTVVAGTVGGGGVSVALHEIGHQFDYIVGDLRHNNAFCAHIDAARANGESVALFGKWNQDYYTQAGIAGYEETIAEGFANYFANPRYFEQKAPGLFAAFRSVLEPYENP